MPATATPKAKPVSKQELLNKLAKATDNVEKRKIRAKLRTLGHTGGLGQGPGRPAGENAKSGGKPVGKRAKKTTKPIKTVEGDDDDQGDNDGEE